MKMHRIFIPQITGRQIQSASKPLVAHFAHLRVLIQLKIAHICVHRRYHRAAGMDDKGQSPGPEPAPLHFETLPDQFRQPAMYRRYTDSTFFKDLSFLNDPGMTAASPLALPVVEMKPGSIIHIL